jgi:hypothetical protein
MTEAHSIKAIMRASGPDKTPLPMATNRVLFWKSFSASPDKMKIFPADVRSNGPGNGRQLDLAGI